jgi:uroporphyrinogen decarboxylase
MTRRELVTAAIEHRVTPRVPYNIRPDGDMQGRLRQRLGWAEPQARSLGRLDLNDWLDNDVEMIAIPWWNWADLGPDWRGPYPPASRIKTIGTGSYISFYDDLKRLRDETDRYVLAMVYGSHFEKAYFARGFGNFLMDIAGDLAFAQHLCREIVDRNMTMLEQVVHCPEIDGVLLGSDWGSQRGELIAPDVWDELIRPGEQREYDLVHAWGKHVWVQSCGKIDRLIPRLVEMGVDVLNPVQPECMDLAALKRDHGHKLAFWGGINTQQLLPFGPPAAVRAAARQTRDLLAAGGGYILAPAQDVQADVPFANLDALLDVAREGKA